MTRTIGYLKYDVIHSTSKHKLFDPYWSDAKKPKDSRLVFWHAFGFDELEYAYVCSRTWGLALMLDSD